MFCIHCGQELPRHAKFCSQCGKQVESQDNSAATTTTQEPIHKPAGRLERCEIFYIPVQEKIGLFPKEKGRFEAVAGNEAEKRVIASSVVFNLGGLNLYGPEEKNARHKEQLEALVKMLKADGWIQQKKPGAIWYNLKFERPDMKEG